MDNPRCRGQQGLAPNYSTTPSDLALSPPKGQPGEEGRMNRLIGELTREIWDAQGGLV